MLIAAAPLVGVVVGVWEPVGLADADPEVVELPVAVALPVVVTLPVAVAGSVAFVAGHVALAGTIGHSWAMQMLWS
jgi:hypothetical protein